MKGIDNTVFEKMIDDGFTEKMIYHYFSYIEKENDEDFPKDYMQWAHEHGFIADHARALGINESNYQEYISDYDYYRTWPHNSWLKMWINDKLTLKYLLNGTDWNNTMPEYYYYYVPGVGLRNLVDNHEEKQGTDVFLKVLKEKGDFACKPNNGTESVGFHHISFLNGEYLIDGEVVTDEAIKNFVESHPNYLYTEYLFPGKWLKNVHNKIHTLRIVVINSTGNNPIIVGAYIRFAVDKLGETNYARDIDSDACTYFVPLNTDTGQTGTPIAIYTNRVENMFTHPDTGFDFNKELYIPDWEDIKKTVKEITCYLFGTELVGFDIGITEKGMKIMEINGLPGNLGCHLSNKINNETRFVEYIKNKMKEIDNLPIDERRKRRNIN